MLYKKSKKNKIKKIIRTMVILAAVIVCVVMIVDVNRRIPGPDVHIYTPSNPYEIDGVKVTPVKATVYTLEELEKKYPSHDPFVVDDMPKEARYVVYELNVMNKSFDTITFYPVFFEAGDYGTGWSNGVAPINSYYARNIIKPFEGTDIELVALNIRGDFSDDLALFMSYYPDYRVLKFKD